LAEQVKGVQLLVARAIQVDGKVLLSGSEAPCEEGMVMLGPPHPSIGLRPGSKWTYASAQAAVQAPALVTAPIGANGAVHFDAVPEGSYFATVQCQGAIQSEGPETLSVESRDITGLVWRVKPSTSLLLHVVDERRKPVAGAQVMLSWPEREGMRGAVTGLQTDGAGRVPAVPQLYPGVYVARASGGYDSDPLSIDVREGMTKIEATLELKGSATIELEVRDSEGAPVDGLDVSARRCAPAPNDVAQALVSAQLGAGHYRIAPLSPGCYGVAISDGVNPPTDVSMPAGNSRVELAAGQLVSARAVLDRTASVRGRVIDGAGHPLADVWVGATSGAEGADASQLMLQRRSMLATGRVLSDGEGRFTLTGLVPKATYDVRAEQPDGAIKIERNVPADQSLTITMPNTGAIGGVVTDARGRPLADFTLRVLEASTQSASTREFSGANGRFELDGITPGQLQIEAVEPSGQVAQAQAELKPGQTLDGLRLSLPD
jgi:protocatechuate 3,4-dioxygenase beta subunit